MNHMHATETAAKIAALESELKSARQELSSAKQHNANQADSIRALQEQIEELKEEIGECPEYYRTSPIHQFIGYQKTVLVPLLKWLQLNEIAMHCCLSASEHYFRMGRKTDDTTHDSTAVIWWLDEAQKEFMPMWSVWEELIVPMLKRIRPDDGPITQPHEDTR
jgi:hypothetical protein